MAGCSFLVVPIFTSLLTIGLFHFLGLAVAKYQPGIELTVVSDSYLAGAKKELDRMHLEKYTCIFCKHRMYRVAAAYANKIGAKGIVTGESLGQFASQTLDNLIVLTDAVEIPINHPLIGFDKEEIVMIAREIGTFEQSTSHASGCKAVPKGPSTKANLDTIREIENKLEAIEIPLPL